MRDERHKHIDFLPPDALKKALLEKVHGHCADFLAQKNVPLASLWPSPRSVPGLRRAAWAHRRHFPMCARKSTTGESPRSLHGCTRQNVLHLDLRWCHDRTQQVPTSATHGSNRLCRHLHGSRPYPVIFCTIDQLCPSAICGTTVLISVLSTHVDNHALPDFSLILKCVQSNITSRSDSPQVFLGPLEEPRFTFLEDPRCANTLDVPPMSGSVKNKKQAPMKQFQKKKNLNVKMKRTKNCFFEFFENETQDLRMTPQKKYYPMNIAYNCIFHKKL